MEETEEIKVEKITDQSATGGPRIQTLVRKDLDTENVVVLICPKRKNGNSSSKSFNTHNPPETNIKGAVGGKPDPVVEPPKGGPERDSSAPNKTTKEDSDLFRNTQGDNVDFPEADDSDEEYIEIVEVINSNGETIESTIVHRTTNELKDPDEKEDEDVPEAYSDNVDIAEVTRLDSYLETICEENGEDVAEIFYDAVSTDEEQLPVIPEESETCSDGDASKTDEECRLNESGSSTAEQTDDTTEINPAEQLVVKILKSMRDYKIPTTDDEDGSFTNEIRTADNSNDQNDELTSVSHTLSVISQNGAKSSQTMKHDDEEASRPEQNQADSKNAASGVIEMDTVNEKLSNITKENDKRISDHLEETEDIVTETSAGLTTVLLTEMKADNDSDKSEDTKKMTHAKSETKSTSGFIPISNLGLKTKKLNAKETFMREVLSSKSDSEAESPTKKEYPDNEANKFDLDNAELPEPFSPKSPKSAHLFKKKSLTPPHLTFTFNSDETSRRKDVCS